MDIQILVGKRIKQLRTSQHITQERLAHDADLDRTYINSAENGKRNISIVSLEKIVVDGLGLSLYDFFDYKFFK